MSLFSRIPRYAATAKANALPLRIALTCHLRQLSRPEVAEVLVPIAEAALEACWGQDPQRVLVVPKALAPSSARSHPRRATPLAAIRVAQRLRLEDFLDHGPWEDGC